MSAKNENRFLYARMECPHVCCLSCVCIIVDDSFCVIFARFLSIFYVFFLLILCPFTIVFFYSCFNFAESTQATHQ